MKRILAIVAHPDDEVIGVGGTLCRHIDEGDVVKVVILGDGKSSRRDKYEKLDDNEVEKSNTETKEALLKLGVKDFHKEFLPDNRFDSMEILDLAKLVSKHVHEFKPETVYTHHFGDLNIDHQMCSEAAVIACRPTENETVKQVFMFETLSSTEMAGYRAANVFLPNYFVNIQKQLDRKINSMSCYKSELKSYPHPRSLESIKINAQLWGTKVNTLAVEPFFLFRELK